MVFTHHLICDVYRDFDVYYSLYIVSIRTYWKHEV